MANAIENFMSLSNAKKVTYILLTVMSVGAAVMLFQWANRPQYQVLYANLSQSDAASIMEKLSTSRIPYKVEGGGTILVASDKVYETRLELAGEGLPRGGEVGFEIFDDVGFGISEFTQRINYLRATQGELAKTIGWLSEIENARVHVVVPEKKLFSDEEEPRASVVLKLRAGRKLSQSQVQGIVHLVASSVAGLKPQRVTVIDTDGRVFTRSAEGEEFAALTSSQLDHQRSLESDIERRIQEILEPVVGKGKVIARVSAEVDFKQIEKTEERFDPNSVVVRSEQRNTEKSTGPQVAGGVPGVLSNMPGGEGEKGIQSSPPGSQRQNEVINYEISKTISRIVEPSGVVAKLSVAVLVDGNYEVISNPEGGEELKYSSRTDEEMAKFEDLVRGVIGFNAERGDKVEVVNIPFDTQEQVPDIEGVEKEGVADILLRYIPHLIRYGTIIFMSVILFLFVVRPLISALSKGGSTASPPESALPEALRALERGIEQKALAPTEDMKSHIIELASQDPQQAAQIIKVWLKER